MKKATYILITLFTIALCQSCVIEGHDKPNAVRIGATASEDALAQIFELTATVDQLRVLDMWCQAETQQEKIRIEDDYFPFNKIRMLDNDTISVSPLFKVYTAGKPLLGNKWTFITDYASINKRVVYQVEQIDNKNYTIERVNNEGKFKIRQTVEVVIQSIEYIVTNQTEYSPYAPFDFYDCISYSTTKPITLSSHNKYTSAWWDTCVVPTSGEIIINMINDGEIVKNDVTKTTFTEYTRSVLFRGIEKTYSNTCIDSHALL